MCTVREVVVVVEKGKGERVKWMARLVTLRPDVSVSVSFFLFPARYHVWGRDHVCVLFLFLKCCHSEFSGVFDYVFP